MDNAITNACLGKSKSQGGLNLPDIKKLAKQQNVNATGSRVDILSELCSKLGLPTNTTKRQIKPVQVQIKPTKPVQIKPVKPVKPVKPSSYTTEQIKNACLGKSKGNGGLNLPDIRKLAVLHNVKSSGTRDVILFKLCQKLKFDSKSSIAKPVQAVKPVKPVNVQPVKSVYTIAELKNLKTLCEGAKFNLHDDYFKHITGDGKRIYYKGKQVKVTEGAFIAKGIFGEVYKVTVHTPDGNFICAYKISKNANMLEELQLIKNSPQALTCDGVLSMVNLQWKGVLMPLASGELVALVKKVNFNQALEIAYRIGTQLKCLSDKGMNYYDLKLANCVYFCRKHGEIDVALADLGSMISSAGDYASTYPPPRYHHGMIPVNIEKRYADQYYTYLLINMVIALFSGRGIAPWNRSSLEYNARFKGDLNQTLIGLQHVNTPLKTLLSRMHNDQDITGLPPLNDFLSSLPGMQI